MRPETLVPPFAEAVIDLVDRIPAGMVLSYGDVAAAVGEGGPRQVGRVMAVYGSATAWWRVIRTTGEPARGLEFEQLARLREEGAPFAGARRVDMRRARWTPGEHGRRAVSASGDEIITCLEMSSPDQLVPGRRPPRRIDLLEVGPDAAQLVASTYVRIWTPLGSGGRMQWSEAQWRGELSRPGVRAWIARVQEEIAGLVELEVEPRGDVGIVVFGLVPELVGRGFGGAFLTLATRRAWHMRTASGRAVRRVWLQTSSRDHPHARSNYERRGFRVFRTERRAEAESPRQSA